MYHPGAVGGRVRPGPAWPRPLPARKVLMKGTKTLAVSEKNAFGGQYIDVGLVEVTPPKK